MNLTPREKDKLLISVAAMVARGRLARGVRLNHPEAIALIADFVVKGARDGRSVADLMRAVAHGMAAYIGSIEVGKRADLVLWSPAFFGAKPEMVLLGGSIVMAQMGDPNASIPTPQPVYSRPMFGAMGRNVERSAVIFTSQAAVEDGLGHRLGLAKDMLAVQGCRGIGKADMRLNDAVPEIEVNPETYEVRANGEVLTCKPARELPLAQRYFLY